MREQGSEPKSGVVEVEEQIKLGGHKWHISCIDFSENGVYFASGSWDKQVKVWDLRVLTTSFQLGNQSNCHEAPVTTISWFPNVEFLLASGSADNSVRIWNSETGDRLSVLQEHTAWVLGSSFNSSGSLLATSSWDKTVGIWDINTLTISQVLQGHASGVWKCVFRSVLQDDNILCSASEDASLKIWDLRDSSNWHSVCSLAGAHDDAVKCCSWSPCGNYIAAGSADSKISVWDVRENKPVSILQGHSEMVTGVKFMPMETAPTSQILVSVGDTTCRFWCPFAAKNSKELCSVRQHELDYEVETLDISPDGTLLATGGRDNKIALSTVSINDAQLEKWNVEDSKSKYYQTDFLPKKLVRRVSEKSSAVYVDKAVQQNEMLEIEKAKKIAKQTVKVKVTGTSDILQSKLLEMKLGKNEKSASFSHEEANKGQASPEKPSTGKGVVKQLELPDRDYSFNEESLSSDNQEALYENGLILNSIRDPASSLPLNGNDDKVRLISSASNTDSLQNEIEDVANELIRISEEQLSFDEKL